MALRSSSWNPCIQLTSLLALTSLACGGPDEERFGEAEDEFSREGVAACHEAQESDMRSDLWSLCQDPSTPRVLCNSVISDTTCFDHYAVHRCFDPQRQRHVESLSRFGCWSSTQGLLSDEDVFRFALTPQPGADAGPLYRCKNGGNDRTSRSPTCDDWNKAPVSRHGFSYAPNTPGTTPVYRCKRNAAPNDWFLSRRADCEGHVRQLLLGYAR